MFCIPLFFDPSFRCSKLDGGSSTAELIAVLVDSQHSSLDNETNGDVPNCSTEQEGWRSTEQFQLKSYEEQDRLLLYKWYITKAIQVYTGQPSTLVDTKVSV